MLVLRSGIVTIRKPQHCWGCARLFPAGTEMFAVVSKDMKKLSTGYWCDVCDSFISAMNYEDDFVGYGELRSVAAPEWEEHRKEVEGKPAIVNFNVRSQMS